LAGKFARLIGQMPKVFRGLTSQQAREKLAEFGPNKICDPNKVSAVKIILRQLKGNFMIYLLLVAAAVSFFVGEALTGYTVFGVILMVIGVSFFQEYRAEKAIASLREMITPICVVIRDGQEQEIMAETVVPEDILVLRAGEKIPADATILSVSNCQVNESILTGESRPVPKNINDQIFAGTFIIEGKCTARVTQTGMQTKFGGIVNLISKTEKDLPLMNKINQIAQVMVVAAVSISVATGGIMLLQAENITSAIVVHSLIVGIALMVSAFPEGLPVVLVTSLAYGAHQMAKNNAIVNRMSIIETLGETTVICADKTGTITTGEMTVEKIISSNARELLTAAVLCSDFKSNSTETALLKAAAKEGILRSDLNFKIVEEVPFSSERKMMTVVGIWQGKETSFSKGAPEIILSKCQLTAEKKKKVLAENKKLNEQGFRTIAVSSGKKFLGLVAMADPPREEVSQAIKVCQQAGIKIKMITGDHKDTAQFIAKQIGLKGEVVTGDELDQMSDEVFREKISGYQIFVRVRPEHKLRIVKILKSLGEIVTMTGDGVNDAPALKEAQIGVAMGIGGTDVARAVSDLTLKDNNFAMIVLAIKEGRTIFNNMKKFTAYMLSCNFAELAILFFGVLLAPILGWQTPVLLALQILFMNLVTDDLPATSFAFNKSSADAMEEPPRATSALISRSSFGVSMLAGILMAGFCLGAFYISFNVWGQETSTARTTALLTLILLEIVGAFSFRSFRYPTLNRSPFTNKYLFIFSAISLLSSAAIIYLPINQVFETVAVGGPAWLLALGAAVAYLLIFDGLKLINTMVISNPS